MLCHSPALPSAQVAGLLHPLPRWAQLYSENKANLPNRAAGERQWHGVNGSIWHIVGVH